MTGVQTCALPISEENFDRIAKIWSVILGTSVTSEDVAMMMIGLKVARYASKSGFQPDTWVDVAGYAGCGYEVGKKLVEKIEKTNTHSTSAV